MDCILISLTTWMDSTAIISKIFVEFQIISEKIIKKSFVSNVFVSFWFISFHITKEIKKQNYDIFFLYPKFLQNKLFNPLLFVFLL